MNTELILQNLQNALIIAVIGMSVVMIFLTLMMGVMKITGLVMGILNKYFPEEIKEEPKRITQNKQDEEIAVAIAVAMKKANFLKGGQ